MSLALPLITRHMYLVINGRRWQIMLIRLHQLAVSLPVTVQCGASLGPKARDDLSGER